MQPFVDGDNRTQFLHILSLERKDFVTFPRSSLGNATSTNKDRQTVLKSWYCRIEFKVLTLKQHPYIVVTGLMRLFRITHILGCILERYSNLPSAFQVPTISTDDLGFDVFNQ